MSRDHILSWAVLVTGLLASLLVHRTAGTSFPVPWADEALLGWQAEAWMSGTLLSPRLHPSDPIVWMFPGYLLPLTWVFGMFGVSLESMRGASWMATLGVVAALWTILAPFRPRTAVTLVLGWFLLGPDLVVMANLGRMEALFLALALTGWLLVSRGRIVGGLALLLMAGLVHPNAVYFLAGAAVLILFRPRPEVRWRPDRIDGALLAGVAVAFLLYAGLVLQHGEGLVEQWGYGLGLRETRAAHNLGRLLSAPQVVPMLALLAGTFTLSLVRLREHRSPLLLAGVLAAAFLQSGDHYYRPFLALAVLLLTAAWIDLLRRSLARPRRWTAALGCVLVLGFLLQHAVYRGQAPDFTDYPASLAWEGMRYPDPGVPYLTGSDVTAVADALDALAAETDGVTVRFYPEADALQFVNRESDAWRIAEPIFTSLDTDWAVIHRSRYWPPGYSVKVLDIPPDRNRLLLEWIGRADAGTVLHDRDGTESWRLVRGPVGTAGTVRPW